MLDPLIEMSFVLLLPSIIILLELLLLSTNQHFVFCLLVPPFLSSVETKNAIFYFSSRSSIYSSSTFPPSTVHRLEEIRYAGDKLEKQFIASNTIIM